MPMHPAAFVTFWKGRQPVRGLKSECLAECDIVHEGQDSLIEDRRELLSRGT